MFEDLVCFCIFTPAPVVGNGSMRNAFGPGAPTSNNPDRIGVGQYTFDTPTNLNPRKTSIIQRASGFAGFGLEFNVTVEMFAIPGNGGTRFNINIFDGAGALTDAPAFVEVTVKRLPV